MASPNPWMILPFALLLGAMAVAPLLASDWWRGHYVKVALGLGAFTLGYYVLVLGSAPQVLHAAHDYASFILLLGSLFIVSGGIHLGVRGGATPLGNVIFLFVGAMLANVVGTTGAAMLLIRPWIRANRHRVRAYHIAFFIFLVANVGGCLTPIGDPPLFLGYLHGVPFWWVAKNCWPMWAAGVGILLAMFYAVDQANFRDKRRATNDAKKRLALPATAPRAIGEAEAADKTRQFDGLPNLFFLAVILGAVFITRPIFLRESLMLAAALGSYFTTKKSVHAANGFNFHPIQEVAVLFAGIFATMMPALDWLNAGGRELLGAQPAPAIFYWGAGGLSAVLDNAPAYLGFLNALSGAVGAKETAELLGQNGLSVLAISIGAVFFGAATYIGNGPNFMIKAIADREKIPMPGFPGFVLKFTLPFLLPTLITVWLLFFRG